MSYIDLGWTLSCLPATQEITTFVEEINNIDCSYEYWKRVDFFCIDQKNVSWSHKCLQTLLKYERPFSVIDTIAFQDWSDTDLILETLDTAIRLTPEQAAADLASSRLSADKIEDLFTKLHACPNNKEQHIAQLELAYWEAFYVNHELKCLIDQILSCPEIYIDFLSIAFRSDDCKQGTPDNKKLSSGAYNVLFKIHRIPGFNNADSTINENVFFDWVRKVTDLAAEKHYVRANEIILGNILSFAPVGRDGIWPVECVRTLLENSHSKHLENGFIIGKINQRGVYYSTHGLEEEHMAKMYENIAEQLQLSHPHTAALLQRISDRYSFESRREKVQELMD